MNSRRFLTIGVALALVAAIVAACTRDPNVRKHNYYAKAVKYFNKANYRAAAIELRNALKIDPRYADAHYELAQCDLRLGYTGDAYRELMNTVSLAPRNWKAQVDLGYLLYAAHQFDKAKAKADLVLSQDPNNSAAHALQANLDAVQGHSDQAVSEMRTAVKLDPTAGRYVNLALLEARSQDPSGAESDYKKAVSLDPKSAVPYLALGAFYASQRRFSDAEQQMQRAIEVDPKGVQPRADLVRLYLAEGQMDKAEQAARDAKQALKDSPAGDRILGEFYAGTRQATKALAEYASLYREHPHDLVVAESYTRLLIAQNEIAEASKVNEAVLKRAPKDVAALIDHGQILMRQGHANDAIVTLQSALKAEPDNPALHYYLGLAFQSTGQAQLAEREWREAVRERPNFADAQAALAAAELGQKDFDGLKDSAGALVHIAPASPLGYSYLAIVSAAHGDMKGAKAQAQKAIEVAPKSPVGYTRLGELLAAQKQWRDAEKNYQQALGISPGFGEALRGLVGAYLAQRQTDKAIAAVQSQIAKVPGDTAYYTLLGGLLTGQKKYAGAEAALSKAVEIQKKNAGAWLLLAKVQEAQGQQAKAMATCQQDIEANPGDFETWVLLGILQQNQGQWQKAQTAFQKALQIKPDYPVAANNLAYLMLNHGGNTDVALSLAQTARQALPETPSVADTLAFAYYQKGAYDMAESLLEEAIKKAPNDPDINYHMGLIYQQKQDKAKAAEYFRRVLKVDPQYGSSANIRQALQALGEKG